MKRRKHCATVRDMHAATALAISSHPTVCCVHCKQHGSRLEHDKDDDGHEAVYEDDRPNSRLQGECREGRVEEGAVRVRELFWTVHQLVSRGQGAREGGAKIAGPFD